MQIVGGGFVDGIVFHPTAKGLSYARTDIGGAYRRDGQRSAWVPITDWVSYDDVNEMGPESIALDPRDPDKVYVAAGMYPTTNAVMLRSHDRGRTFERTPLTFGMGGNADGRGNGERMRVDPNDGNVLFFGSRTAGLWTSTDASVTWKHVDGFPAPVPAAPAAGRPAGSAGRGRDPGDGIVFVLFDPRSGSNGKPSSVLYAGESVIGQDNLFRSADGGATWQPVPGGPTNLRPTRGVWASDASLYVAYGTSPGPSDMTDGAVWKFDADAGRWTDVTPEKPDPADPDKSFGYGAVAVDAHDPRTLLASSFHRRAAEGGEELWRTTDGGAHWTGIFHNGAADGVYDHGGHPYTAHTPIHWLLDVEIDPFDPNHAVFTTGYGGWETFNLADLDAGKPVRWSSMSRGIEETVALALLSPTGGDAHLVSAIGDYGGFVHRDLDQPPPEGNYTNPFFGNTTDVAAGERNPQVIVRVGSQGGGLNGGARGNLGYSLDGGTTWQPPKASPDGAGGFIAVSTDGNRWVWAPRGAARRQRRPGGGGGGGANVPATQPAVVVTADHGDTWTPCNGLPPGTRAIADPVNPRTFYAVSLADASLYTSTDGGLNFTAHPLNLPGGGGYPPRSDRSDRGDRGDNRGGQDRLYATPGAEGDLWLASYDGLYHSADSGRHFQKLDAGATKVHAFGFGKAAPGAQAPAIYLVGTVAGQRGVYRSDDAAQTWTRINDDQHQWGLILQITGDPRLYGRAYIGTHGRGILYGDVPGN